MSQARPAPGPDPGPVNVIHFSLAGLLLFSLTLIAATAALAVTLGTRPGPDPTANFVTDPGDQSHFIHSGPWGDLICRNLQLERPVEYLNEEVSRPPTETWTFKGLDPAGVKTLLLGAGLGPAQVNTALSDGQVQTQADATILTPPASLLGGLDAVTRAKLYLGLAGRGLNIYVDYPFIFPGSTADTLLASPRLAPADARLLARLIYPNGAARQLSDYQYLLGQIPTQERRVAVAQVMSRQSAVLAGLVIKPDTDIDKLVGYWGLLPGVRFTDMRPLLESLKALPHGGTLPLFYVLPKFARERLYTFPLPPKKGDPVMDCHWSTFNFCNDTPDNRFNDPVLAVQYIGQNYYQIAAPSRYGDILLLMNDRQEIKHSAVFLADDLVFTKNGDNYRQPWMIMHIPDLLATYPATPPMHPVYLRPKQN